mgnify:CR=1 FL=1
MKKRIIKICDYCKRKFITKNENRVTYSNKCSRLRMRAYNQKPEIKAKKRLRDIQKNIFIKEFKNQEKQRIFNILLNEEKIQNSKCVKKQKDYIIE